MRQDLVPGECQVAQRKAFLSNRPLSGGRDFVSFYHASGLLLFFEANAPRVQPPLSFILPNKESLLCYYRVLQVMTSYRLVVTSPNLELKNKQTKSTGSNPALTV